MRLEFDKDEQMQRHHRAHCAVGIFLEGLLEELGFVFAVLVFLLLLLAVSLRSWLRELGKLAEPLPLPALPFFPLLSLSSPGKPQSTIYVIFHSTAPSQYRNDWHNLAHRFTSSIGHVNLFMRSSGPRSLGLAHHSPSSSLTTLWRLLMLLP